MVRSYSYLLPVTTPLTMGGRMKKAIVSTSEDGATWFPRAETDNMPKEWVAQFPEGTRARWIRLEFVNEHPDFAHISHFVTFTR